MAVLTKRSKRGIAAISLVLSALFCVPAIAADRPAPRPAMEQANAEADRLATLERLREQYPGIEIPEGAEIIWVDTPVSGDTSAPQPAQDLLAGFQAPVPSQNTASAVNVVAAPDSLGGMEYISDLPLEDKDFYMQLSPQEIQDAQLAQIWMDVKEDLTLRDIDRKAMALVKEFAGAKNAMPPTLGQNGATTYNFGDHIPKIVCRTNRVTDIALQAGEQVTGVHMGDTVRWEIAPAKSGAGSSETVHVIVKPLMPDISTNLVVMTDKRTYNLDLMSSSTEFIPSVRFAYPEDTMAAWNIFMQRTQEQRQQNDETVLSENYRMEPEDLNFGYKVIRGSSYDWAPVRIFDDGTKTYIEMPEKFKSMEAPVVMFYEGRQQKIVNYRLKDRFYIIDRVMSSSPGKAALMLGQSRVIIQKLKPAK